MLFKRRNMQANKNIYSDKYLVKEHTMQDCRLVNEEAAPNLQRHFNKDQTFLSFFILEGRSHRPLLSHPLLAQEPLLPKPYLLGKLHLQLLLESHLQLRLQREVLH